MAASQQLVQRWNERLAVGERLLTNPSPRLRWLGRVYIRLYRFLLSVYGRGEWRSDTASPPGEDQDFDADASASRMPFVDLTSHDPGAPAKSLEQIRYTLKSMHLANSRTVEIGPLREGLQPESWIAIGETRKFRADVLCEALRKAEIQSQLHPHARREIIYVRYRDYERALVIANKLATFRTRDSQPALRPKSKTIWFTPAAAGAVIGFLTGPFVCIMMIVLYFALNEVLTNFHIVPKSGFLDFENRWKSGSCVAVVWMLCVFLGAWIGHRRRRPSHQRENRDAAK